MSTPAHPPRSARASVLGALALLYAAQGIPFGFAAEYLPVVLRRAHYSRTQIAALFWLQLPWQLKPLWAGVADHPAVRPRARAVLLALQAALATTMAAYAAFDGARLAPWFALTALAALLAATQDVFVDAFAVRNLADADRGFGNSAQIAGYRVGIIAGGGVTLILADAVGPGPTLLACAAAIALAGTAAFALRARGEPDGAAPDLAVAPAGRSWALLTVLRGVLRPEVRTVAAVALTYKLGTHAAATLVKPMLVDAHWTPARVGWAVATVGTGAAVAGSLLGGGLYRLLGERAALAWGAVLQALGIVPLLVAVRAGVPFGLATAAIAVDHLASGLGTTVLFAALMTATRKDQAALHYTVLTSLNALAIGLGGLLGARLGDLAGPASAYTVAALACLLPLPLLGRWTSAARASAT